MDCFVDRYDITPDYILYDNGNEHAGISGGWGSYAEAYSDSYTADSAYAALSKLSTSLHVSWGASTGSYSGAVRTLALADLTSINTLSFHSPECSLAPVKSGGSEYVWIFIRPSADTYWGARTTIIKNNSSTSNTVTGSGTYTFDVSSYSGLFYVGIGTTIKDANAFSYIDFDFIEMIP